MLGDADAVGARSVEDEDAASAGRFEVDIVDAGASPRDDTKERRRGDQFGCDFRCASDDECVGVGDVPDEFGGRSAGPRVDRPAFAFKKLGWQKKAERRR